MIRLILMILSCLLAGMAHADFQLQDPANQIMEEVQEERDGRSSPGDGAGDSFDEWVSRGVGNTSCDEFVTYREERSRRYWTSLDWLQEFIGAVGFEQFELSGNPDLETDLDPDAVGLWIKNYCYENPQESLARAAEAFIEDWEEL